MHVSHRTPPGWQGQAIYKVHSSSYRGTSKVHYVGFSELLNVDQNTVSRARALLSCGCCYDASSALSTPVLYLRSPAARTTFPLSPHSFYTVL